MSKTSELHEVNRMKPNIVIAGQSNPEATRVEQVQRLWPQMRSIFAWIVYAVTIGAGRVGGRLGVSLSRCS